MKIKGAHLTIAQSVIGDLSACSVCLGYPGPLKVRSISHPTGKQHQRLVPYSKKLIYIQFPFASHMVGT